MLFAEVLRRPVGGLWGSGLVGTQWSVPVHIAQGSPVDTSVQVQRNSGG
jgi:hypothetical protein